MCSLYSCVSQNCNPNRCKANISGQASLQECLYNKADRKEKPQKND